MCRHTLSKCPLSHHFYLTLHLHYSTVLLSIAAIVVFPFGIDSKMVQHPDLCGESAGSYELGDCTIGWAYITVITGTTLGLVAVALSWTPMMCNRKNNDGGSYAL